jgi:NhaA family Na+:H+ antiporter
MIRDQQSNPEATRLPKEFVDRLTNPFVRFLHIESAGGVILLFFEHAWETQLGLQVGPLEFRLPRMAFL